jgi:hypothetical protein
MGPFVLQLFLMLGVLALWKGVRFGRRRSPETTSRRAFEQHVRALGLQYQKAGASRLVLGTYAAWAIDRLKERASPGGDAKLSTLAATVAERTGRREADVLRTLVEAHGAKELAHFEAATPEDLTLLGKLHSLVLDLGAAGDRRGSA